MYLIHYDRGTSVSDWSDDDLKQVCGVLVKLDVGEDFPGHFRRYDGIGWYLSEKSSTKLIEVDE